MRWSWENYTWLHVRYRILHLSHGIWFLRNLKLLLYFNFKSTIKLLVHFMFHANNQDLMLNCTRSSAQWRKIILVQDILNIFWRHELFFIRCCGSKGETQMNVYIESIARASYWSDSLIENIWIWDIFRRSMHHKTQLQESKILHSFQLPKFEQKEYFFPLKTKCS